MKIIINTFKVGRLKKKALISVMMAACISFTGIPSLFPTGMAHAATTITYTDSAQPPAQYYVSTTGSDSNPGTISSPFKTIQKASNLMVAGDTVILRGGTYNETITPQTDGTSGNPITYKAYPGETVTISGSAPVTGWTLDSGSIYKAPMNWDLGDDNQVFVSGEMMRLAQYPNWTNDSNIFDVGFASMNSGNATSITHSAINKPANYWAGATVIVKGWWSTQSAKVTSSSGSTINFNKLPWSDQYTNPSAGVKYMISGVKGELDRQREWYYDKNTATLYLWAPGGVDPNTLIVEAKQRKYAVDLTGRSYINIEGVNIIGASITTKNASFNTIKGINAQYLSHTIGLQTAYSYDDTGIDLSGSYNTIRDSQIAYSSGNGVVIRGNNNNVINNLIHETDYLGTYNASVSLAGGKQHLVSYNTFYNTGRSIIGGEKFSDSIIEFNDMSRTGILSYDLGGVYFARVDGGSTEIRNNWIHDMDSQHCNGCELGIYIDSNTHNFLIHHNTVWNAATSYYVGGRADNVQIYNNQAKPKIIVNTGDYKYNDEVTNNISEGGVSLQNGASSISAFIAGNVTTGYNQSAFGTAGHNFTNPPNPIFAHSFPEFSNRSLNYGFEADLEGWTLTGNSNVTYHFAPMLSLGDQFATTRTADGSALFGSGQNGIEQVVTGLQANTVYEFSGWAKVATGEEAWLGVKNYGASDRHSVVTNTSNGWRHVQIQFTTGASNTSATIYMLKNSTGSGAVYGDDIGLRKVRSSELPDPNRIEQSQMTATASSQETVQENDAASKAIDGDTSTIWHTKWNGSDALPQSITLNLGGTYNINKLTYLPRQSGTGGIITGYKVYVSTDGTTFTSAGSGTWSYDSSLKTVTFPTTSASYVKLEATASPTSWASAAEINVFKSTTQVEVPTAPTGLTATAGDGQVTLSWNGVTGADTYKVYRGTSSGTYDATAIATVSGSTTNYTVTGLTNATIYYFAVKASNTVGDSSFSTEASAAPRAISGSSKVVNSGFETGDKTGWIGFGTWSVVNSNQYSGAYSAQVNANASAEQSLTGLSPNTTYVLKARVKVSNSSNPVFLGVKGYGGTEKNVNITGTTFQQYTVTFTTGASNTSAAIYLWRNGTGTGYANGDDFEVIGAPTAPTGLTATAGDGQVTLSWNGITGADNYKVYRGTTSGTYDSTAIATVSGSTTNYTVTGLTNATIYYFAVKASNTAGDSSFSTEASAAPKAVSSVTSISVNGAGGAITLSVNGTLQMQANVLPSDSNSRVTWNVFEADGITATDKATINANGLLTAIRGGTVKVVAAATDGSGVQGSTSIKIESDQMDVALDKANLAIGFEEGDSEVGVTKNIHLITSGANGTIITWSSDTTSVIDANGKVTRPLSSESDATVRLSATITKGTVSDTRTFVLNVLKGVPPVDAVLSADITAPTNRDVTVTISYPSDATVKEYKVGGNGTWTAYTKPVVVSANDTVYAQSKDAAGNVSNVTSYTVSNIDKTPPADATLSADVTAPTNRDVIVTISYPDDAAVMEYKVGDNGAWTAYGAPVVISENSTVYARGTDAAGNVSNETNCTVSNIDHIAPIDATLAVDTTAPTNQGVTVMISYPADASLMEYKVGVSGAWTSYTAPVVVSDNDTVYARGINAVGNVSNVTGITVSNIHKIAPVTTATLSPAAPNGKNSWYTTDVTVSLSVSASVYGGSVTTEYQVNDGQWIIYTGSIPAFGDGTYKLGYRSKDQAGNVEQLKTVEFKVDKTASALSVQLDKTSIWPANHKMVTINTTLNSSDATSGVESVVLTSITSNQLDSGQSDIQANFGTAATSFSLRAEKSRIYTITYTATDKAGNKTVESVTVTVPHDQSSN
ncbi:hypothetical protein GC098_08050 [Paenibacillus sp. LMG 31458]|uniref:DUF1565 domain-containing protein n=1 Tax=Paenibacillus phytorum TaxID=2654977 RepID=A0ABX1XS60_9BACL|nr:immunoglobulin-like domain-containing protein [Paenibacillus phytorum]NOU71373.1 hypothetical protein [Paenibacillus phytorum]